MKENLTDLQCMTVNMMKLSHVSCILISSQQTEGVLKYPTPINISPNHTFQSSRLVISLSLLFFFTRFQYMMIKKKKCRIFFRNDSDFDDPSLCPFQSCWVFDICMYVLNADLSILNNDGTQSIMSISVHQEVCCAFLSGSKLLTKLSKAIYS